MRGKDIHRTTRRPERRIIPAGAGKRPSGPPKRGATRDHPRGCGEKAWAVGPSSGGSGSSPRVRGKDDGAEAERGADGIIPAGAGKRAPRRRARRSCPDHPRGCGEKAAAGFESQTAYGSSPRVRGKVSIGTLSVNLFGIIPAGAGKSHRGPNRWHDSGDHPRGCGEKLLKALRAEVLKGSSPRVRGKGGGLVLLGGVAGIIPAGAGKRARSHLRGRPRGDHPRGCGEKESGHVAGEVYARIIPAGAGKSADRCRGRHGAGDHPRGCGEKRSFWCCFARCSGSSPRVRGKAGFEASGTVPSGIIPAGAGKRWCLLLASVSKWDHPRGCGEKGIPRMLSRRTRGSSPRVRGKAGPPSRRRTPPGIIPAGAGKSHCFCPRVRASRDHPRGCGEKLQARRLRPRDPGSSPRVRGKAWKLG